MARYIYRLQTENGDVPEHSIFGSARSAVKAALEYACANANDVKAYEHEKIGIDEHLLTILTRKEGLLLTSRIEVDMHATISIHRIQ